MSFTISAVAPDSSTFDSPDSSLTAKAPVSEPTATEQIHALALGGQSLDIIASSLGVPISQVDSALDITPSSTSEASALSALSGRLSVEG
ncbi:MAG: hypothetical protein ABR971_11750 [Acidobacteriaceae bacterium]|jgi:hypothetical protein